MDSPAPNNSKAYHVTKISLKEPQPNWKTLKRTVANDRDYDGWLLGLPVVFLTTSWFEGKLPDKSPYPRKAKPKTKFWRLEIPLNHFKDFSMWLMGVRNPFQAKYTQVHILLTLPETPWDDLLSNSKEFPALPNISPITKLNPNNQFLFLKDGIFTPNDMYDDKFAVNIELVEEIYIPTEAGWGNIESFGSGTGSILELSAPPEDSDHHKDLTLSWLLANVLGFGKVGDTKMVKEMCRAILAIRKKEEQHFTLTTIDLISFYDVYNRFLSRSEVLQNALVKVIEWAFNSYDTVLMLRDDLLESLSGMKIATGAKNNKCFNK